MGRYTGPKTKISRRFGEPIYGPDKTLERRNCPPGMHGGNRRRKLSEYGTQLKEKQKAKFIYGMREGQFRRFFEKARAMQGNTGDNLMRLCESRLDNVVFRMGLAPTRPAARQLVSHRHIEVNGKLCNIPSYIVRPGETVAVRERDKDMRAVVDILETPRQAPCAWVEFDKAAKSGTFVRLPETEEIPETVDEQAIVEFYSR